MKRAALIIAIVAALAFAFFNLIEFRLERLMVPSLTAVESTEYAVIASAFVLAGVAVRAAARASLRVTLGCLGLIVVASFAPRVVDAIQRDGVERADRAEGAALEAGWVAGLKSRQADVAARIAEKRAYAPDEAFEFVMFVEDADFSWRGYPDHSTEGFAILDAALAGGLVDPNGRGTGGEPLFLRFYDLRIKPTAPRIVARRDWEIEKRLVAHKADLSDPAAAELRANLARKETPGAGRFVALE